MAMPSQMPGRPKNCGQPPPAWTPFSMNRSRSRMPIWPGMRSVKLVATPIIGLSSSSRVMPVANKRDLCGARSRPFLILSLLKEMLLYENKMSAPDNCKRRSRVHSCVKCSKVRKKFDLLQVVIFNIDRGKESIKKSPSSTARKGGFSRFYKVIKHKRQGFFYLASISSGLPYF